MSRSRWPQLFPPRIYELTYRMLEHAVHAELADLVISLVRERRGSGIARTRRRLRASSADAPPVLPPGFASCLTQFTHNPPSTVRTLSRTQIAEHLASPASHQRED
jgi:hypothetical protein